MLRFLYKRTEWSGLLCALLFCAVAGSASHAAEPQLDTIETLSAGTVDNRRPSLDATPDGRRIVAVWDGLLSGNRRIFLRESIDGLWLDPIPLDAEPAANNSSAVVKLDSTGSPHVVWVADVRGCDRIFYAFRVGSVWNYWGSVCPYEPEDSNMEAVSMQIDPTNRPWIVWQSGRGSHYVIRCAHLDPELGSFEVDTLAPPTSNYNINPQIFLSPAPTVYWYSAQNADFALLATRYDAGSGTWSDLQIPNLDKMPACRLPSLVRNSRGLLTAVWRDELDSTDRVFVGEQDPVSRGAGTAVGRPDASSRGVAAATWKEVLALASCAGTRDDGSQLSVLWGRGPGSFGDDVRLSVEMPAYCLEPRLVVIDDGAIAVWESSLAIGGTGSVCLRRIGF